MCAMSDSNSRRIIQIGGPNAPRGNPVYSVPLQTTATINIQLGGVGRTNAAGIGSGTAIRMGPRGAEMVSSAPKGILKSGGGAASQLSASTQSGIYGQGARKSAAGTLASGEIVPQTAQIVQSSRSKYESGVEHAQLLTSADVHSLSDRLDGSSINSATYLTAAEAKSAAIQTEGSGNLSDAYSRGRPNSMGTQIEPGDLGTLRKPPSESIYSSNQYGTSSQIGTGSNTGGGSEIYGTGSTYGTSQAGGSTYGTSQAGVGTSDGIYSGIDSQSGDNAASEPVYSAGSVKSGASRSSDQVYAAAPAGILKSSKPSAGGEGTSEGIYNEGGDKIYADGEGDKPWMESTASANAFRFIGWEVDPDEDENLPCKRVLVMKEPDMVLMFTASCQTEAVGNNPKLLDLMVDIADSCVNRLRILIKDVASANIAAENMDSLPLSDGRHTKDHLEQISKELNETVAITDVAFRFQPPDGTYLGTFVQGTVVAKRNYAIGKVGVVAVLTKKSKFATVEAFSEQLCEHIARTKPANLGTMRGANTKHMTMRGMNKLQEAQRNQLLLQNFIFDQTIVVAEAARRSFCKIEGFLLFK